MVRNLYLTAMNSNLYLTALASNLYLPALAPNLYLPALAYNFISSPGPEFAYTSLVSSICITGQEPEYACALLLVAVVAVSGSSNKSSGNFFGINNTNISMPILVN